MHAIQVSATGGPEQMVWTERDVPEPAPGQVLVRVAAAGVNFIDVYQRKGLYPMGLPFTPGQEGAGVVEVLGADTAGISVGARVAWTDVLGSYGELAVLPSDRVVVVPDEISLDDAAAVMLQGSTAHYLTHDTFPLTEGQHCLIHAGAGGVGRLLIQIAKMKGAHVFATTSTAAKAEVAHAAGADHVILYTETDFGDAVTDLVGEKALDVVYDGVGAATLERGLELLRPRGMMVTFGNASGRPPE
ncbi:MAG: quinone oxidoreductase, partial [Acidimicrobiia bacterium]